MNEAFAPENLKMLTQKRLHEMLEYSPKTGIFIRKISTSYRTKVRDVAGYHHNEGYISILVDKKLYLAHRLAFFYMEGYFPEQQIDHLDGVKNNNRWKNLRHASNTCNSQNRKLSPRSTSGFISVSWNKHAKKWCACIKIHAKKIHLGCYDTAEKAALARCHYEDECPDWTCNHLAVNRVKLKAMGYKI